MRNLVEKLLPRLEAHRLSDLDAGSEVIYPYYEGYSLANIPASVCAWLGVPEIGVPRLADPVHAGSQSGGEHTYSRVILVVVDGMGLDTLEAAITSGDADLAVWGSFDWLAPLTSLSPSTTAAALTTLWTGVPPAGHGVMAYEVWLKEYSMIANMIRQAPLGRAWEAGSLAKSGFNPSNFLPVPTLGRHLRQHNVKSTAFQHFSIARSGLSTMLMGETEIYPYRSLSDLWVTLEAALNEMGEEPSYYYIYWGDLDEHSHLFGPGDPRPGLEFSAFSRQFSAFLRSRRAQARGDTLLLVTADHGHIATPPHPRYELRNHPELRDLLAMYPSGEARLPLVYLRPGRESDFLNYLESTWPGEFVAIPSDLALQSGLFGGPPIYRRTPDRIGDYVIVPQGAAYWFFSDYDNVLRGRHGGLSRTEMLIPLLGAVL